MTDISDRVMVSIQVVAAPQRSHFCIHRDAWEALSDGERRVLIEEHLCRKLGFTVSVKPCERGTCHES